MRTIPGISKQLRKLDEAITAKFIPAVTGGIQPNEQERELFSLPSSYGGLGIPIFSNITDREFSNSQLLMKQLQTNITNQIY